MRAITSTDELLVGDGLFLLPAAGLGADMNEPCSCRGWLSHEGEGRFHFRSSVSGRDYSFSEGMVDGWVRMGWILLHTEDALPVDEGPQLALGIRSRLSTLAARGA
jgi:hypothetical protein